MGILFNQTFSLSPKLAKMKQMRLKTCLCLFSKFLDSAYVAVKQSLELTESEQPIFKQLDIDKTLTHKLCKFMG